MENESERPLSDKNFNRLEKISVAGGIIVSFGGIATAIFSDTYREPGIYMALGGSLASSLTILEVVARNLYNFYK